VLCHKRSLKVLVCLVKQSMVLKGHKDEFEPLKQAMLTPPPQLILMAASFTSLI